MRANVKEMAAPGFFRLHPPACAILVPGRRAMVTHPGHLAERTVGNQIPRGQKTRQRRR